MVPVENDPESSRDGEVSDKTLPETVRAFIQDPERAEESQWNHLGENFVLWGLDWRQAGVYSQPTGGQKTNSGKYPRATLRHDISQRTLGDGLVLLSVRATITNTGEVLLSIASADTRVQQILPPPPGLVDAVKEGKDPVGEGETEVRWPLLFSRLSKREKGEFQIEPGESDFIQYDFILKDEVRTVEVYTYLKNEMVRKRNIGWNITTPYDIGPPPQVGGDYD